MEIDLDRKKVEEKNIWKYKINYLKIKDATSITIFFRR
jgi:hypothetical protein